MSQTQQRYILNILLVLSILGLLIASYQIYSHYTAGGACGIVPGEGCSIADSSIYAEFLDVPVAILGTVWFLYAIAMILTARKNKNCIALLLVWCGIGILSILRLIYGEYVINALCALCTAVHIILLIMTILTIFLYRKQRSKMHIQDIWLNMKWWFGSAVIVNGILVLFFQLV